jgi:hypothetical protein
MASLDDQSRSNIFAARAIAPAGSSHPKETIRTTEIYLRVDPSEKLAAVEAVLPLGLRRGRFKAPDALLASLFDPG